MILETSLGNQSWQPGAVAAYVIFEAVITDPEQYAHYRAAAGASVAAHGGRYLVRGGATEACEGPAPARIAVLEFPTMDAATAWYHSEQYTEARALRESACDARLFIVDGT